MGEVHHINNTGCRSDYLHILPKKPLYLHQVRITEGKVPEVSPPYR